MFALFLFALVALTAVAALGVLADSGLRWWSAFGQLRREAAMAQAVAQAPALRPSIEVGYSRFTRRRTVETRTAGFIRAA